MRGEKLLRTGLLSVVLALALMCGATGASAATGGTNAPHGGSSSGGSSSGGVAPGSTSGPKSSTGGISPTALRTPSAPVKPKPHKKKKKRKRGRHGHPAPAPAPTPAPTPTPAPAPPTTTAPPPPAPAGPGVADIPPHYLALYKAAGAKYGVDWRVLAAMGKNESDHGRSTAPGVSSGRNYAGCCSGPMQICTVQACSNTWGYYAIDGDGDGVASVYDPDDAIYAAAALVRDLKAIVGDDPSLLLAAYNAGPGNVKKYKGIPPFPETQAYVKAGLAYIAALR